MGMVVAVFLLLWLSELTKGEEKKGQFLSALLSGAKRKREARSMGIDSEFVCM